MRDMPLHPKDFLTLLIFSSVNIPWPEGGMTDADYIHAFQKVVMPIAMEFAPELVISTWCWYLECLLFKLCPKSQQASMLQKEMI